MRCGVNRGRTPRDAEGYQEGHGTPTPQAGIPRNPCSRGMPEGGVNDEVASLLTDWRSCISQIWYGRISPAAIPSVTM